MNTITIEGQLRTGFGKTATRQLRSQDQVPGVIYGGAQEISFSAPAAAFKPLVYTPNFQFAEVKLHVDLLELVEDKKVIADIPVKFTGVAKGVKDGGKLITKMKSLKVKTYPKYLKEQIEVAVDELDLNGNIRVEDVKIDNYEILNSPRIPIVSVVLTRQLKQEEATTPGAAPAAPAAGAAAPAAAAAAPAAAEKGKKK
jgi:large subunit ribosomal protein L25